MAKIFQIHPKNPQLRLIQEAVDIIQQGGVVIYPTDASYAIGCHIGDKKAADRIRQIRQLSDNHNMTLMCRDLSDIATFAIVDNTQYRLLKSLTPGPYTFLLKATKEVPKRLQHPKRKTIGIRVPDCPIAQMLLQLLQEPLMTTSLILPKEDLPLTDPESIIDKLGNQVDGVIDGGYGAVEMTTVLDLTQNTPALIRQGLGDTDL
jgi:tRNA threonylcarbamoyl adenosine modification protein (Sua5/YciO/YrdC/YwlC family)